ncbi:TetR/AcrR family transcriptional regulator [Gordonia sp. L191]|uniref:TetR/AcrR family transcriptional regulator n=1 Tax=Gordonia sp. L191 TaxID=2982699 RepID=UPI0024C09C2A|nr:TetR/AcrR family transcriptional regulator [Gordonia sp. L191]WHU46297.1 TetR/AcrR family transcriptional regulator [Gordonia sp. L191]
MAVTGVGGADNPSRLERRKHRTRSSLVRAGQQLLAEGRTSVSVLDITNLADVGNGSFYNHFASKDELFEAAVLAVLDDHGAVMDSLTADLPDPAEAFTQSFRLTGRLHRRFPQMSRVVVNRGIGMASADAGLIPRARRDIEAAVRAQRFDAEDVDVAVAIVAGAALSLAVLLHAEPERDDASTTDQVTKHVLRSLGVVDSEIARLLALPLPELT